MNHKRLAAALLTALALTTLPAMGTAFAEDGVDAVSYTHLMRVISGKPGLSKA